jgi:aquaporin Z
MVYMGGHISGAHYNPAVTVSVLLRGRISAAEAAGYVVVQLVGAVLAAVTVLALVGEAFVAAPGPTATPIQVITVEILFTFALVLVILNVAVSPATKGNSYYGLAIGFTVAAGAAAGGGISGGAFNPAVGLGPALVGAFAGAGFPGSVFLDYLVAPLLGGGLASIVYGIQARAVEG